VVRTDGQVVWVLSRQKVFADASGKAARMLAALLDITERKEAERALGESEERFRQTFELAASGIAHIGLDRKFMRVNRRLCEILGYAEHELIGLTGRAISHPADLDRINAQRPKLYAGEFDRVRIEKRYLRKDGSTVWVNLTVALARNAAGEPEYEIAIFDDITERKKQETELRRFRLAMDTSLDAIYLTDPVTMRFVDVNTAACQRMGYTREQLLQMGPQDLLTKSLEQIKREYVDVIAAGESGMRTEQVSVTRDGKRQWTELNRRVLQSNSEQLIVTVARDITGRKLGEERQAVHVRFQEKVARFGASALSKREAVDLVEDALQNVMEALPETVVAYVEPDAGERELYCADSPASRPGNPPR
jgi:PAS domain S-box-containing protein